jgi:hypothetical protein
VGLKSTQLAVTAEATPDSYLDAADSRGSEYVRQLQRGRKTRFEPSLESAYIAAHLDRARLRVRTWFTLTSFIGVMTTLAEVHRTGFTSAPTLFIASLLLPCDAILVWLCWSRFYKRAYARAAPYLITVLGVATAVSIARGIAEGRGAELSALTTSLVAISFFSGLMFRQTLSPMATTLLSFLATSIAVGVPTADFAQSMIALVFTAGISLLVGRDIDCSYRKSFLESAVIRELVARDGLSGLMNRRSFDDHLLSSRALKTISCSTLEHSQRFTDSPRCRVWTAIADG